MTTRNGPKSPQDAILGPIRAPGASHYRGRLLEALRRACEAHGRPNRFLCRELERDFHGPRAMLAGWLWTSGRMAGYRLDGDLIGYEKDKDGSWYVVGRINSPARRTS